MLSPHVYKNIANNTQHELKTEENILNIDDVQTTVYPVTQFDETEQNVMNDFRPYTDDLKIGDCIAFKRAETQEEFLTRAYLVDRFTWTEAQDGRIANYTFPQTLIRLPPIANKLRYYNYLRTGFKFFFMVNGTPFHYGLLKVRWIPASAEDSMPGPGKHANQWSTLQAISNMPGVDILAMNSRTYEFKVPYELAIQALNLVNVAETNVSAPSAFTANGTLEVWIVNPLRTLVDGASPVSVSIYAALEDPILFMPMPRALNFEGIPATSKFLLPEYIDTPIPAFFEYQGKESKKKTEKGVVSSTLDSIAAVTPLLAAIPEVGEVAMAVGTVANIASGVASLLGYSKNTDLSIDYPANIRYPSPSLSRGAITTNKLTMDPENEKPDLGAVASGDNDEYLLSRITSTYTFLGRVAYTPTSSTLFERIIRVAMKPNIRRKVNYTPGSLTYTVNAHTMSSYVSNLFKYYRGGIRVKFEFVFSQFHTQRFRVFYTPSGSGFTNDPIEQANCLSKVITVNGYHTCEITIPYNNEFYALDLEQGNFMGYLFLVPISGLTVAQPSTSQVYINTYFATDTDAEFFMLTPDVSLRRTYTFPIYPDTQFVKEGPSIEMEEIISSGGNFVFTNPSYHLGDNLTGESIRSVKDIIQRATAIYGNVAAEMFKPAAEYLYTSETPIGLDMVNMPYFLYFSLLYRFRAGGFYISYPRIKATDVATFIEPRGNYAPVMLAQITLPTTVGENDCAGFIKIPGERFAPYSVKIPFMYRLPFCYNNVATVVNQTEHIQIPTVVVTTMNLDEKVEESFISAADDFNFYKLFAPPTLFYVAGT